MNFQSTQNIPADPAACAKLDVARIRADFPILSRQVHGKSLIYLDSAATTQKPKAVIEAMSRYYEQMNSNVHRGVHQLSLEATEAFEQARDATAGFIGAGSPREIIFTRGTTESVNLVAQSYARPHLKERDEILISHLEHHSNIVPWQLVCEQTGAHLKVAPVNDEGEIIIDELEKLLSERTRIVAINHVSNALGTINPIKQIAQLAHAVGAAVLVDGAQAAPHVPIDVRDLGCDFYCFSAHKMFGPTGTGVLYGREHLLDAMPPYQGGGEMIKSVTLEKTTYNDLPHKFEAGTPNIAGVIGLGAAVDYIDSIGHAAIAACEDFLLSHATEVIAQFPEVRIIGTAAQKVSVVSFIIDGIHAHDIGTVLDHEGIAIRTGHHCTQPLMERFGLAATARASLAFYNTDEEIEALGRGIRKVLEVLG